MNYPEFYVYVPSVIVKILVASAGLKGGYWKALATIIGTNSCFFNFNSTISFDFKRHVQP